MPTSDDITTPLTVDVFDQRAQQHEFELRKQAEQTKRDVAVAKQRTKQERATLYLGSVIAICVTTAVVALIYFIYQGNLGPDGTDPEIQREQSCIADGGGYVPADLLAQSKHGLCVFPGKRATTP